MGLQWGRMATDLSQVDRAAADGFDFVQPSSDFVGSLTEEQFLRLKSLTAGRGVPFLVCALPLPADVRVTQRGFNLYVWTEHLKRALHRLAELGCRKLVWSDGRARVLPVEGERAGLKEQVMQFLFMLCDLAAGSDMTVLIEPLGPRRSNFLNSLEEVREFLPGVGKDNLSSLISLRELAPLGLAPADLARYKALIDHVQLENPQSASGARTCPRPNDGYDYGPFLRALKGMGYSGGVCLPEDSDASGLAYCRKLWG
jgi:sugar phosphate isomerase/epimerase